MIMSNLNETAGAPSGLPLKGLQIHGKGKKSETGVQRPESIPISFSIPISISGLGCLTSDFGPLSPQAHL